MTPDESLRATGEVVPLVRPAPGSPPAPRVPDALRLHLAGGLRLVAVPHRNLPQTVVRLLLPAGSVVEPDAFPGTASLVGDLLTEGTVRHTAEQLNQRLDALGASLGVHVTHDLAEVELQLLSETLIEALPLLAEIVGNPVFPPLEVERVRREALDALEARHDEPANLADDLLAEAVFGRAHPYGRFSAGTEDGIRDVDAETLHAFHQQRYRPGGSTVIVVGDFDPDGLPELLGSAFADWTGTAIDADRPPVPSRAVLAGHRVDVSRPDAPQAEIRLGAIGMERGARDWIAGAVANYLLGGSTITGRFGSNLREDKGWTYGARSAFSAGIQPAGWIVETAVDTTVAREAVAEIRREIERLATDGPNPDELRRARETLVLSLPRAFETASRIANRMATLEAFRLPETYWREFPTAVRSVSAEEVVRIVERYMRPDDLAEVVVA